MSHLLRLVYASRSTFAPGAAFQGLDPGIARILAKSRKNNAARGIVGGLLFGDGCFLQCLEGSEDAVDALYEKIRADTRHQDVTVLSRRKIEQTSFGAWSMKYAAGEASLRGWMQRQGLNRFDPYAMSASDIEAAVAYMERVADSAGPASTEKADRPAVPVRKAPVSFIDTFKTGRPVASVHARTTARTGYGMAVMVFVGIVVLVTLLAWRYVLRGG